VLEFWGADVAAGIGQTAAEICQTISERALQPADDNSSESHRRWDMLWDYHSSFNRRTCGINSPHGLSKDRDHQGCKRTVRRGEIPRTTGGSRDARSSNARGNSEGRGPARGSARESQMVGIEHEVANAR
jgi:hypothetical protein